MKISVCGKGGSGKSAIATLLANCMRDKGYHVLVVDSDESNSGLYRMLGFEKPPVPILELVGGKKEVKSIFPKTPLAESEGVINVIARSQIHVDDIPPQYIARRDGLSLVCIGKILQSLEGCACPMGVLSREFLRKLQLKKNEIAVVDMEAGVEHFGRGVETSIDIVLLVVDPSFESLELAGRVKTMTGEIGIGNTQAILNKVTSDDMAVKLKEELRKRDMPTIGCIAFDSEILEAGLEGRLLQSNNTREAVERIVDTLLSDSGKHG